MAKHDPDDPFADIPHDDDPFADIPLDVTGHHANADGTYSPTKPKPARSVVDPDMPHTTAEHWNGTSGWPGMKQRAQHASNASYQRSLTEDEENRPVSDDIAAGVLGAANAMDSLGVADEYRGYMKALGTGAGGLAGALSQGQLPDFDELKADVTNAYRGARDQQREATAQAEENSPLSSGAGQFAGTVGPAIASIWAKAPALGAQAIKNSGPLSALLKSALAGSAMGGASGLGHGEGDVDEQLKQAGGGALVGAGLGAAGAALPAATMKLAPKASLMPVGAGLRAAPREAAGNVATAAGKAGRFTLAAALDALATGVGKAPLAGGAAVGGHLGGPVGAGVGGLVGQKVLGAQADALAGKLSGKADAVRAKNAPPTKLRALLDDAFAAPQLTSPSGLALDTTTPKVNAEMARLKRAIADEQSVPVADEDVVSVESATNPFAQAMANAREGGALSDLLRPVTGGPTSPSSASPRTPPPMPPQSGVMRLLVDTGLLSPPAPKSGATWSLSSQALRANELPAPVRARLQKLADDAAQAEPSTTQDTSGAAGFDDGVSAPVDEYGVPLDQFPLEESVAAKPSALAKQRAEQPPPPRASPPSTTSSSLPSTAVMTNPTMGRLRIAASRENAAASPWSDALDAHEAPAFDEHGNELPNPAIREGWRAAAARHAAPLEGGPATSTADMLDEDVNALLGRGGRTKGGLQGSSAYHSKRNADLVAQGNDPNLALDTRRSARDLVASSRTAPNDASAFEEPLPSFVTKSADEMGFSGEDERSSTWKRREEGFGVLSASAEQRALKRSAAQAREDALPADRDALLRDLLALNETDSPSPKADAAWRAFVSSGRKGPRPQSLGGGTLDAFDTSKNGARPSSLSEAWDRELRTRGIKTWAQLRASGVLDSLAEALGIDQVHVPDDVNERHLRFDLENE
jgi:hypothetical protein